MAISGDLLWDAADKGTPIVAVGADGDAGLRLRLRQVGGRITEHDPDQVARVLIIRDTVVDSAKLRLRLHLHLHGKRVLFGRPGSRPAVTTWRRTCPRARVQERNAWWGMPGVPDQGAARPDTSQGCPPGRSAG
ncbi:hypothetical protein [Streptomyces erythrochromogenes]|uniref:hypothetical protein n=1 Tax=Streptomyces erythrochromogenes TaxID=285574 RepID=UPI0038082EF7